MGCQVAINNAKETNAHGGIVSTGTYVPGILLPTKTLCGDLFYYISIRGRERPGPLLFALLLSASPRKCSKLPLQPKENEKKNTRHVLGTGTEVSVIQMS